MPIDAGVSDVLTEVRVVEFAFLSRIGEPQVRPMSAAWVPNEGHLILTTPLSYPQKVFDVRRDGRVALFFSDFTGSGLPGRSNVLVQGVATAPHVAAAPHEVAAYWREVFRRNPHHAEEFATAEYREAMEWYYWRLPIFVRPLHVHSFPTMPAGGGFGSPPAEGASMSEQIVDALDRYPTAVFTTRDAEGHPYAVRASVTGTSRSLDVRSAQPIAGVAGPASLLWHRHDGRSGDMLSLLVVGMASESDGRWRFVPTRIPGALPAGHDEGSWDDWIADGRRRSVEYLDRRGLKPPMVDWSALAALAPG